MASAAKSPATGDPEEESKRLVARVVELGPLVRERAREAEALGRLTDDVFAALVGTEVFRALTPRRWGGRTRSCLPMLATVRGLSRSATSSARAGPSSPCGETLAHSPACERWSSR